MRVTEIALTALLAVGLLASTGTAAAAHDNPNWGDEAGSNDCTVGHMNPQTDGDAYAGPDDCGLDNGDVPDHAGHPVPA